MDPKRLLISAFLGVLCYSSAQSKNECIKAHVQSCGECIQVGAKCGWCTDTEFLKQGEPTSARCDELESLRKRGCSLPMIENPQGSLKILKDKPVTKHKKGGEKTEDITQIQPQKLAISLRSGEPQTFNLKLKIAKDYPLDLYYLIDLSYSKKDDLEHAKMLGTKLMLEMSAITSDFRIGLGFIERTALPDTSTISFRYKNVLKLTRNGEQFKTLLGQQQISSNLDSSEGGLDAIMQVAVCEEHIGWRNVTRLLVFSTDTALHFGDSELGQNVLPNDGKCHLANNTYTMTHHHDHSPKEHLVQKLNDNNIQTIFVVTEELQSVYEKLRNLIPKSAVGTLSANPSNVIKLLTDAYNSLSSVVILENSKLPEGVSVTYQSRCKNGVVSVGEEGRKCSNISIGDEVFFSVKITVNGCPKQDKPRIVKIRPLGTTEEVEIDLSFICECECQKKGIVSSELCHNGTLECGTCRCDKEHTGQNCECWKDDVFGVDLEATCRKNELDDICSNKGNCVCGKCECKKRDDPEEYYSGKYCECDNFNCDRANNRPCGGHGRCECRVCVCDANYAGSACDCSLDTSTCLASNNQICNGRGICVCGSCRCTDPKFQGPTCEICPTCPGVCTDHKECVQCRAFGTGEKKDTCERDCSYLTLIKVKGRDDLPQPVQAFPLMHCKERHANDCWFYYTYFNNKVNVVETLDCPGPPSWLGWLQKPLD